jgi:hypothetical protein
MPRLSRTSSRQSDRLRCYARFSAPSYDPEMTPPARWLDTLWPLIRARLPAAPARVLEVGCGSLGGFVAMLRADGYDAVGIDPQAPDDAHYQPIEFELRNWRSRPTMMAPDRLSSWRGDGLAIAAAAHNARKSAHGEQG